MNTVQNALVYDDDEDGDKNEEQDNDGDDDVLEVYPPNQTLRNENQGPIWTHILRNGQTQKDGRWWGPTKNIEHSLSDSRVSA